MIVCQVKAAHRIIRVLIVGMLLLTSCQSSTGHAYALIEGVGLLFKVYTVCYHTRAHFGLCMLACVSWLRTNASPGKTFSPYITRMTSLEVVFARVRLLAWRLRYDTRTFIETELRADTTDYILLY